MKKKNFKEGIYKKNQKGFGFVKISEEEEIHIAKENSLRAMNGDRVLVKVIEEKSNDKKGLSKQWIDELDKFTVALSEVKLELTMDSMEFYVPSYFSTFSSSSVVGIYEYNAAATIILLKKLRKAVISFEGNSLPGNNTAYNSYGLATNFLRALSDFEDCFLEYVDC